VGRLTLLAFVGDSMAVDAQGVGGCGCNAMVGIFSSIQTKSDTKIIWHRLAARKSYFSEAPFSILEVNTKIYVAPLPPAFLINF
jgi:hypothetical protein